VVITWPSPLWSFVTVRMPNPARDAQGLSLRRPRQAFPSAGVSPNPVHPSGVGLSPLSLEEATSGRGRFLWRFKNANS
jgi:hypothetical protein